MLKSNFAGEVPACTAPELLRRQGWRLFPADDPEASVVAQKLSASMIKAHGGVWISRNSRDSGSAEIAEFRNYEDLEPSAQAQIDAQIEAIVAASFDFIHYNGLTRQRVARLVQDDEKGRNPFDGCVVIIDEVHNFISRAMNKRLIAPLYQKLVEATDCKIILLSGTPIINRVAELAYIVNLVQGRIALHVLTLKDESTQEALDAALKDLDEFIEERTYDPGNKSVRIRLVPHGFRRVKNLKNLKVARALGAAAADKDLLCEIDLALKAAGMHVQRRVVRSLLPLPDDPEVFDDMFVDWEHGTVLNPGLLQRRIIGAVSAFSLQDRRDFAQVSPMEVVHASMSGFQFLKYTQLRYEERRRERNANRLRARQGPRGPRGQERPGQDGDSSGGQVYRTFSLALCTFAFPDEIPRLFRFQIRQRRQDAAAQEQDDGGQGDEDDDLDREYEQALESATRRIKAEMPECLRVDDRLALHSPKFHELLKRLATSPGPSLIYSQFRRAEGLGLLSAAMDINGWEELRLKKDPVGGGFVVANVVRPESMDPAGDQRQPKRYVILRTEEDPEANRLLLHIFNNELDELPRVTRESLDKLSSSNVERRTSARRESLQQQQGNLRGAIAGALLITASGAEGISLKNVRQVHMLEGFWNHNRLTQVIGRAVRARSHLGLPEADRNVRVFLYLSTFTDEQREDPAIMRLDKGLTSDQYVHTVAMKKKHLTDQVLALVRSAAVDCELHRQVDGTCYRPPVNMKEDDAIRTPVFEEDSSDAAFARRITQLRLVQVDGTKYFLDVATGTLYDFARLKGDNELVPVGQI
jgi:hypothetical protein